MKKHSSHFDSDEEMQSLDQVKKIRRTGEDTGSQNVSSSFSPGSNNNFMSDNQPHPENIP